MSYLIVFGAGEYFVSSEDVDQLTPEGQVAYCIALISMVKYLL